jgi:hypothetical protein
MLHDEVKVYGEKSEGEPLIIKVVEKGEQIFEHPKLNNIRSQFQADLKTLPESVKKLEPFPYKVIVDSGR